VLVLVVVLLLPLQMLLHMAEHEHYRHFVSLFLMT